jgi:TolB-like protein
MAEKEMEERAKMAIKMEQSVGVGAPIENSIAVLYFLNILENSEWNAISKGLAEMMITDFSQIKSLKVIERIQLQKLMDEMALGLSGLAEAATAPRMGKLMRARNLVNGSFMVKAGKNLTINSDLVDVNGTQQYDGNEFSGKLEEILNLEKKVVFSSLINLGIQVSNTERDNINKNTTKSLQAFLAYCKGLDQYDQKDIAGALISFNQSIKLDPNFQVAQKQANLTQAITIVQQGRFPTMHRTMRTSQFASAGRRKHAPAMGFRQRDPIRLRLQQVSNNLDLGYLPGNSSRNGSSEIINEEILDQLPDWTKRLDLLPEPPKPPSAPPTIR